MLVRGMGAISAFLTFSLAASAAMSSTGSTLRRVWDCQIAATMKGSGLHFSYYGQDAWSGPGSLYCESEGSNVYRDLAVTFNSMYDGFGADRNSTVQLVISLKTQMNPHELQLMRPVVNDHSGGDGAGVAWNFASQLNQAEGFVTFVTPALATRSLQRGTLYIRSAGE